MEVTREAFKLLEKIREKRPLVHAISNMVTANVTANALLQIGGLPVMADSEMEVEDVVRKADALVLNMGMINEEKRKAILKAGKAANRTKIPIILDPVGVGSSKFRNETIKALLDAVDVTIIRCNLGEASFLGGLGGKVKGVESDTDDIDPQEAATLLSKRYRAVAAVTGKHDYITDGYEGCRLSNGHPFMSRITGSGCMSSAVVGAFAAVSRDYWLAAAAALMCFGTAGELAGEKSVGPGSFSVSFMDSLFDLDEYALCKRGKGVLVK